MTPLLPQTPCPPVLQDITRIAVRCRLASFMTFGREALGG